MMPDSVQVVIDLLKTALGESKYTYFDSDPDLIPVFNLPAIVVEQLTDETDAAAFYQDDVTDTLLIKVILNKKDDWEPKIDPLNLTQTKLRQIVAGRDATTGKYLPATIKGAFRPEVNSDRRVDRSMAVEYGVLPRPNDTITAEAHVTVKIMHSIDVDQAA